MTLRSSFQSLVGDDLDAKTGQSLVVMHRRGEVHDRGDAEVAQDLRTNADLAPLPVAIGFRGLRLAKRGDGNTRGAIAQVNQHAAAGALEMLQHDLHLRLPGE